MVYLLCVFKIDRDINCLNSFVDFLWIIFSSKFPNISVNFEGEELVDHILKIPRILVFGVKSFNRHTIKSYLQNNPAWNKDKIEVAILFPCWLHGKPCIRFSPAYFIWNIKYKTYIFYQVYRVVIMRTTVYYSATF